MTAFTASRDLRDWTTALASQTEPSALVLDEPSCYHIRTVDSRLPLRSNGIGEKALRTAPASDHERAQTSKMNVNPRRSLRSSRTRKHAFRYTIADYKDLLG